MGIILPSDSTIDRYGLHARLVREDDAAFILGLRIDPKRSRFIHSTDNDVGKQIQWIKNYKNREKIGSDYYFIYSFEGKPIAVNRLYDITYDCATCGSWLCKDALLPEQSVSTLILLRDILFEILNLDYDRFDVRKANKQVLKLHKMFGARITGETDIDFFLELDKNTYKINKENILRILNI